MKAVAYIDGANLHQSIKKLGWSLDYRRFRVWLAQRYSVSEAYIFLGYVSENQKLYSYLSDSGFILVFKDVVQHYGITKGNCDADLVLHAVKNFYTHNFDSVVLVSSDGDYASLVQFLLSEGNFNIVLSPAPPHHCSILLKRTGAKITYLEDLRSTLATSK